MKMNLLFYLGLVLLGSSCQKELIGYRKNDLQITLEKGQAYLHDFPLFLGIKTKNPPQIAIWAEDTAGHYLSTIYVTHKAATASWQFAGGNRRKEALPHWGHARGICYADGIYLPTGSQPLTDGISGATPRGSFDVKLTPLTTLPRFIVKIEVNHSTDWNSYYPKSAQPGESGYSGGKGGSGQPAVVYAAYIDLASGQKQFEALPVGHSSPDGSNGEITSDLSTLTTALQILKKIIITVKE